MKYDFKNDLNWSNENKAECFGVVVCTADFILKVMCFIMSRRSVIFTLSLVVMTSKHIQRSRE